MAAYVTDLAFGLFSYNKQNYSYDRHLRQKMEYQLTDMKLVQAHLWRDDIRTIMQLTLHKCECYLLVITLELGMCVTALCKGRVPPGAPPWLAACHTLSLTAAFMYLFMALWLGLHAYVAAQAYKVRILTHFVRLPIPQWQTIEAARTYQSSYEKMKPTQVLRVPFAMGSQESVAGSCLPRAPAAPARPSTPINAERQQEPSPFRRQSTLVPTLPGSPGAGVTFGPTTVVGGDADGPTKASDPWALERRADDIPEIAPDVNERTERQRHVYRCRVAAQFYETYDAFCRIAMSTGTCSLATFLCYFCLTYVLTENASPVPAWAGMLAFIATALTILRLDMKLTGQEYFVAAVFMIAPPMLCAVSTFANSKGRGDSGVLEWYMPIVPLLHGLWYVYFLSKFQVRELEGGAVLPAAFGSVLYLDSFGWSKLHLPRGAQRTQTVPPLVHTSALSTVHEMLFGAHRSQTRGESGSDELPALQVQGNAGPARPEDTAPQQAHNAAADHVSFRSSTFAAVQDDEDDGGYEGTKPGDKPGQIPWNTYRLSTIMLACLWFCAAGVNVGNLLKGGITVDYFHSHFTTLKQGKVMHRPIADLQYESHSSRLETKFVSLLTRPRGLSCDPKGQHFVTSGLDADGQESLLQASLSSSSLHFKPQPHCLVAEDVMEDVSINECGDHDSECETLLLPRHGKRLVPCRGTGTSRSTETGTSLLQSSTSMASPINLNWLDDRGAAPLGSSPFDDSHVDVYGEPEAISAVAAMPCVSSPGRCLVVGTTARRVVQLMQKTASTSSEASWLPNRILSNDVGEVPGPGAFALLGESHVGVLLRKHGILRLLDLQNGGTHTSDMQLPKDRLWSSVCAGGDNVFAMENGDDPSLFRFNLPVTMV